MKQSGLFDMEFRMRKIDSSGHQVLQAHRGVKPSRRCNQGKGKARLGTKNQFRGTGKRDGRERSGTCQKGSAMQKGRLRFM